MGLSVRLTAVVFLLVLVSTPHPTAGGGHDPLLVLDGYEDSGIRLKCFSERLFAEVQLLWTDGRGGNVTGTPLTAGTTTGNASSSTILKPGSGNSMSCKIIDKLLKTSTESSVVIADVFFPATSPWLTAFVMLLLLSVFLVIAAVYKLRKNEKTTVRERINHFENAQQQIQKEIEELQEKLAEERDRFQKESQMISTSIGKLQSEVEFHRARSHAVAVTLDICKYPNVTDGKTNGVTPSRQEETLSKVVAVATEGFSKNKNYWEVEVGGRSEWELGVVCEETRNKLRNEAINTFPAEGLFSLRFSRGQYSLTGGNVVRNCKACGVVGVLLDWECEKLFFFQVEEKCLLESLPLNFSGKLYPFFCSGSDGK